MKTIRISTAAWTDEPKAHDELAKALGFPAYYGKNLDALYDCLCDLDDTHVILEHCEVPRASLPRWQAFETVFRDAQDENPHLHIEFEASKEENRSTAAGRSKAKKPSRKKLQAQQAWIQQELERCADFWLEKGWDREFGGVYTCLDRAGNIYSTDKSVWMQGRCAWTYSYLCNVYGRRARWQEFAASCLDFMEKHCFDREKGDRMYFTVTKDGKPLRLRRYYYSESFYAIANAEYYSLTHEDIYLERARKAYETYWKLFRGLEKDPTGYGPKTIPETRTGRSLGLAMIYLNICSVLRRCDPAHKAEYDERSEICVHDIFAYHHKPELRCTLENVGPNGEFRSDVTEGRIVNPGHDIECSWFLMEYANYKGDKALHEKSENVFNYAIEGGWDKEMGGLLYFIDALGLPPEAYEHDMKLWWPHNEILIASLMAFRDTGDIRYYDWFSKTLDYCKKVFADPEYGEWYGYLRRDGKPTMPSTKGSTFKGPFHLPRSLIMTEQMIGEMLRSKK